MLKFIMQSNTIIENEQSPQIVIFFINMEKISQNVCFFENFSIFDATFWRFFHLLGNSFDFLSFKSSTPK